MHQLMQTYNTDLKVNYKTIEEELVQKVKSGTVTDYTLENVYHICNEVFHNELYNVFGINHDEEYEVVGDAIMKLWENENIQANAMFVQFVHSETNFFTLFAYNTFHQFHKCICAVLKDENNDTLSALLSGLFGKIKENCTVKQNNIHDDIVGF